MKKLTTTLTALLIVVASLFTFNVQAQKVVITPGESTLAWTGSKIIGNSHNGVVNIKSGYLVSLDNGFSGEFIIDMTSIVSLDLADKPDMHDKLVGHLKSDDFFSVAQNPTARFRITRVLPSQDGKGNNYMVTGDLTIKGITNRITFPAHIDLNDRRSVAKASFSIDRSKWDVRYGSDSFFDNLGDKAISNDIDFTITLVAKDLP